MSSPFQPWRQRMSRTRGNSDTTFADQSPVGVPVMVFMMDVNNIDKFDYHYNGCVAMATLQGLSFGGKSTQ